MEEKMSLCHNDAVMKQAADVLNNFLSEIEAGLQNSSLNGVKQKTLELIKSATFCIYEQEVNNCLQQEHEAILKENFFYKEKLGELNKRKNSTSQEILSFGIIDDIKIFLSELKDEMKQKGIYSDQLDFFLESLEKPALIPTHKKPNITNLYVIGNGFDLKHNLPTRYSDFAFFCQKNAPELFDKMNDLYPKLSINGLWSDFESALEFPDIKKLEQRQKEKEKIEKQNGQEKDYSIGVEPVRMKDAFNEWVKALNSIIQLLTIEKRYDLNTEDYFITFNYTNVLEHVYNIDDSKVLHIHEKSEPGDYGCIYGHGGLSNIVGIEQQEIKDYIDGYKKEYNSKGLKEWIEKNNICPKRIIVLGHSMAPVDVLYFKHLVWQFPDAEWSVHYFGVSDLINKLRITSDFSILSSFVCDD